MRSTETRYRNGSARRAGSLLACLGLSVCAMALAAAGPKAHDRAPAVDANAPMEPAYNTDYIIVRVREGVTPVQNANGKWSFELGDDALLGVPAQQSKSIARDAANAKLAVRNLLRDANTVDVKRMGVWSQANAERARQCRLDRYYRVVLPMGTTVAQAQALAAALEAQSALIERAQLDAFGEAAGVIPNDPSFNQLYGLHNTTTPGADIDAPDAWMITTGAPQTVLAILDSGVSPHTELTGRMVAGFNTAVDSTLTTDGCNHGTHVAGTAAASGNNGVGIVGVNWKTKVMPVRVLTGCNGLEADLSDGLQWAADHGAHVVNMSLQFTVGSDYLHDGVLYARAAGLILFAASGNFGTSGGVAWPGRFPETITVGATTINDTLWQFSNPGPEVTVSAPGENIYSLSNSGNNYFFNSGTSMATPHVAGLATLMITVDPTLTHDEIRQILIDTAHDLGPVGFDNSFGYGRVDANAAMQAVLARLGLTGDVNADETLNELDRSALDALLGVQWGQPGFNSRADLNHDGTIDATDQAIFNGLLPPCLADFVDSQSFQPPGDRLVNGADLAYLLGEWGANPGSLADIVDSGTFQPPPDGVVDGADLAQLLGFWGSCPTGGD